jgi:hypothetical protein
LMLHAFVLVFASIIGHTPTSEAGSIISTSQVTEVARAKVQSQVPTSAVCGKWGRVLLVYLQCICYRRGLKMWQLQSVTPTFQRATERGSY